MAESRNENRPPNAADADPIARNPKDVDNPQEAIQSIQVVRRSETPAPTANGFLPGEPLGTHPSMHNTPSMAELIESVLRFKWTIVVISVLVCAPLIGVVWTQITPKFQARAELRIRPYIPHLVFKTEDTGAVPYYSSFVNTQVSIIRSPTLLQRVLDQSEIQETQWYQNPPQTLRQRLLKNPPLGPLERLRDGLYVSPRRRTEIVDVRLTDINRQEAILLVNTVLDQYTAYAAEKSDETRDLMYRKLVEQYKSLETEIGGREKVCTELRRSLGTEFPQELVSRKRFNVDWAESRLQTLQQNIVLLEWEQTRLNELMTQAIANDSNNVLFDLEGSVRKQREYFKNAQWRKFSFDLKAMQEQISRLGVSLGMQIVQETGAVTAIGSNKIRAYFKNLQQSMTVLDEDRMMLEGLMNLAVANDSNDVTTAPQQGGSYEGAAWRKLAFDLSTIRQQINQLSLAFSTEFPEEPIDKLNLSVDTPAPGGAIAEARVNSAQAHVSLSELRRRIGLLELGRMKLEALMTQVIDDSNDVMAGFEIGLSEQPKYHEDAEWRTLDSNLRTIQHRIANSLYGPEHPELARLNKELEFSRERLLLREAQLDEQGRKQSKYVSNLPVANELGYEAAHTSLEHQLERKRREEQLLLEKLEEQQADFKATFEATQLFTTELAELEHKRLIFNTVRLRLDQKKMERNTLGKIDLLTRAFAPSRPTQDRRIVFTVMTLCMGLGLGGGVAFVRAMHNQVISHPNHIPHLMQAPFLGCIPIIPKGQPLDYEVSSTMIESVRALRTALLTRLQDRNGSTILVTSSVEGTGKSGFTMILGKSIAQTGKKVLMIDADLHKMTLTRRFGLLDKAGFIESLNSRANRRRKHVIPTETPNLSIMAAGKVPEGDEVLEVMSNGSLRTCIDILAQQYDIILLDTPPVLPVADAPILAGQIDGAIMVERENLSHRSDITEALGRLHAGGGRLLGTVFVGSLSHHGYRRGYYYSYGYGYGDKPDKPKKS